MDAEPNAWFAGPVAGSASTRTPSTYISGWLESEKLEAPRMRMREPIPTAPVARCMTTPAERALSRSCTPSNGAYRVRPPALTLEPSLPPRPISVALDVPVTTTCDNSSTFCSSATRRFVSPTFTVSVTPRNPILRTWRTTVVPARSSKRNRPRASVKTRSGVPVTVTWTSPIGAPDDRLTTTPAIEPPCAKSAGATGRPTTTPRVNTAERHDLPRPQERRGCLYYGHRETSQGRAHRIASAT